jgi:hypothetical protein
VWTTAADEAHAVKLAKGHGMADDSTERRLPTWVAAGYGTVLGLILFAEGVILGAFEPGSALLVMLGLGALLGVEWNELHFLERHGVAGFFARWALAGASVGATAFGIGRVAEAWPWWGFFGALGLGALLGSAVGVEWGSLLGDPPWSANRRIEPKPHRGVLEIDRRRIRGRQETAPDTKRLDPPKEPDGV